MDSKELAQALNGREYGNEITEAVSTEAKEAGLGVVYGYSDDCMEFEGAIIREEVSCYGGGFAVIDKESREAWEPREGNLDGLSDKKVLIEAVWDTEGFSWTYKTDIPHETFIIMEEGEKYCRGIVFSLDDVGEVAR